MRLTKEFTFDSAHFLKDYHGKCERLHGHTYRLQITLEGPVQKNGMVMDFGDIKAAVNRAVIDLVDHNNLNDILEYSSVENLCVWAWDRIKPELPMLAEVRIWETATSSAIYSGKP